LGLGLLLEYQVILFLQIGPENKIAQSLTHHHFATVCSRIMRIHQNAQKRSVSCCHRVVRQRLHNLSHLNCGLQICQILGNSAGE